MTGFFHDGLLDWGKHRDYWFAVNNDGLTVGTLKLENVGKHRHWCWYQKEDVRMSPGCLQEVRDKQKQLFGIRKKGMVDFIMQDGDDPEETKE